MTSFRIPWPCAACGCTECAEVAVSCMCCGNASFVFESNASAKFYAGQLACPVCGKTWLGVNGTAPSCSEPVFSVNTLHEFQGTAYRYLGSDGYFHVTDSLELARQLAVGPIVNSCGAPVS